MLAKRMGFFGRSIRSGTAGVATILLLAVLGLTVSTEPPPANAAAQAPDYAAQAQAIAEAFRKLGLSPQITNNQNVTGSDNYYSIKAERSQSQPTQIASHLAYVMKSPGGIPDLVALRTISPPPPFRALSLGVDPATLSGSSSTPDQRSGGQATYFTNNDAVVRLGCGNVFAILAFHYDAQLANKDEMMARAETARQQNQLEQEAETTARQFYQALKSLNACPSGAPPAARLNVGIAGNYDAVKSLVDVTAGVENRPGVGIGDDYYTWSLDAKSIKKGIELKTIQVSTTGLAQGKHEISVVVSQTVNTAIGTAAFSFEIGKAAAPAQPPASSAAAQVQLITPSGAQAVNPGVKTPVTLPPGSKAELRAQCEGKVYALLFAAVSQRWYSDKVKFTVLALLQQRLCDKLQAAQVVAWAGGRSRPFLFLDAAVDPVVQAQIESSDGAIQLEVPHALVNVDASTPVVTVSAAGKNAFEVAHDSNANTTTVSVSQGRVTIQPKNPALKATTLERGNGVAISQNSIGPAVVPTPDSDVTGALALVTCGGVSCLGVLALLAGMVAFTRSRRSPGRTAALPVVPRPGTLPEGPPPNTGSRPTDLPL